MIRLFEKLADNAPLVLAIVGVIAFALGASGGGFTYDKFSLPAVDKLGRDALMVIGGVVTFSGLLLLWATNYGTGNIRALARDYGFRIEAPVHGHLATSPVEVRGSFKREPPSGVVVRVLEHIPASGTYWPKSRLVVNRQAKTWSVKFGFGGASGQHREFIVALCGPGGSALFDYYERAGKESGKWVGIQTLPPDVVLRERVAIVIG